MQRTLSIQATIPDVIWPLALHARVQALLTTLTVEGVADNEPLPRLLLRMPLIMTGEWPLPPLVPGDRLGQWTLREPVYPQLVFYKDHLCQTTSRQTGIEILVGDRQQWSAEATVMPSTAISMNPENPQAMLALASLVMPSDPQILETVRRARDRAEDTTPGLGFATLEAREAASNLFREVGRGREPRLALESAPHQPKSQVIRTPTRIYDEGQATCVDLALMLCATFEHIRRLPVIVGFSLDGAQWHVVAGVRLREEQASSPVVVDRATVWASCAPSHVCLFDPDVLISGGSPWEAGERARTRLAVAKHAFMVDVQGARDAGVLPLAISTPLAESRRRLPRPMPNHDPTTIRAIPPELLEDATSGRLAIVITDSLDADVAPSRAALAALLCGDADDSAASNLQEIASRLERQLGREDLEKKVLLACRAAHAPSLIYAMLSHVGVVDTVVALHPDAVLESALAEANPPFRALIGDGDLAGQLLGHNDRELYLLGGSVSAGTRLVLTERDQLELLERVESLARALRSRLATRSVLLLGEDFADVALTALYAEATRHVTQLTHRVYAPASIARAVEIADIGQLHAIHASTLETLAALKDIAPAPLPVAPSVEQMPRAVPYKYLDYFEREDHDVFFGRESDTVEIGTDILGASSRIAVLCGRSGVGKTSLVKAGLAPFLEQQSLVTTVYVRASGDPMCSVQTELRRLQPDATRDATDLGRLLEILSSRGGAREFVIFVDQFEEALLKTGAPVLRAFFEAVTTVSQSPRCAARFVFVVREDFLSRVAEVTPRGAEILLTTCRLKELARAAAGRAVIEPARRCGYEVEPKLVEAMLDDLSPDTYLPAHLQIVIDAVFVESRSAGCLTLAAYERVGRAHQILAMHLEHAMALVGPEREAPVRAVLRALVTSEKTKDQVTVHQLVSRTGLGVEFVSSLLRDLMQQRLVRELSGDPMRFELAHESLAPPIGRWIDEREAKVREVQEILDRELATARKFPNSRIDLARLRLIDDHRGELDLDIDRVALIVAAFVAIEQTQTAWIHQLLEFGKDGFTRALQILVSWRVSDDHIVTWKQIDEMARELCKMPRVAFPPAVARTLACWLLDVPEDRIGTIVELALKDASGEGVAALGRVLSSLSEPRQMRVAEKWTELSMRSLQKVLLESHNPPRTMVTTLGERLQQTRSASLRRTLVLGVHRWPPIVALTAAMAILREHDETAVSTAFAALDGRSVELDSHGVAAAFGPHWQDDVGLTFAIVATAGSQDVRMGAAQNFARSLGRTPVSEAIWPIVVAHLGGKRTIDSATELVLRAVVTHAPWGYLLSLVQQLAPGAREIAVDELLLSDRLVDEANGNVLELHSLLRDQPATLLGFKDRWLSILLRTSTASIATMVDELEAWLRDTTLSEREVVLAARATLHLLDASRDHALGDHHRARLVKIALSLPPSDTDTSSIVGRIVAVDGSPHDMDHLLRHGTLETRMAILNVLCDSDADLDPVVRNTVAHIARSGVEQERFNALILTARGDDRAAMDRVLTFITQKRRFGRNLEAMQHEILRLSRFQDSFHVVVMCLESKDPELSGIAVKVIELTDRAILITHAAQLLEGSKRLYRFQSRKALEGALARTLPETKDVFVRGLAHSSRLVRGTARAVLDAAQSSP